MSGTEDSYFSAVEKEWHTFIIEDNYRWTLLVVVILCFYYIMVGFIATGKGRREILNKEFLEKNFGDVHKEATGQEIGRGGYPDMGSGRYVMAAGYKGWMEFNKGQRIH